MGHPDVAPLYEMKKSLDWEVDKFQGFVRFEEHDRMLGAVIHPKTISCLCCGGISAPAFRKRTS